MGGSPCSSLSSNASFSPWPPSLHSCSRGSAGQSCGGVGRRPQSPGWVSPLCGVLQQTVLGVWGGAGGAQCSQRVRFPGRGRVWGRGGRGLSAPVPNVIPTHGAAGGVGAAAALRDSEAPGAVGSGPPRCRGQSRAAVTRRLRLLPCSASCSRRAGCDRPRPWLCARRPHR